MSVHTSQGWPNNETSLPCGLCCFIQDQEEMMDSNVGRSIYWKTSIFSSWTTQESDTVMTFSFWRRRHVQRPFLCSAATGIDGPMVRGWCTAKETAHWRHLREEMWMSWNHIWRIEYLALDIFWITLPCKPNPVWVRIGCISCPFFWLKQKSRVVDWAEWLCLPTGRA